MRTLVAGLLGAALLAAVPAAADAPYRVAVMQGLDKITARISTFEVPVGETVEFGKLRITARTCLERPPEEDIPESAAFLQIEETPIGGGGEPTQLFSGWMFASSPALSALEHAVYDVWVVDCKNPESAASSSSGQNEASTESASPNRRR